MSEEILINVTPHETRVAVVENGMLQELQIERGSTRGVVGNIYKGKVQRIMPGMQAAFVDIGLERAAFLHAGDIADAWADGSGEANDREPGAPRSIFELLRDGQELLVQVVKDPIGTKGARVTTQISVPSRHLVLLTQTDAVVVSARIDQESERSRLRGQMLELLAQRPAVSPPRGYILRTNAEGQQAESLAEDIDYLDRALDSIRENAHTAKVGMCVYEDLSLPLRAARDLMRQDVERVKVDSRESYERLQEFASRFMPALADKIEHYSGYRPIFDLYGVEDEISRALEKKVPLKSGGSLIIDQTEAMTTIDINTGSFLGQRNPEETVYRTNLEATHAIARQLRLRNLGGIIIIDFIDMVDPEHKRQVLRQLEKSLQRDHAKTTVYDFSPLGLVEMTRKRTTESLERQISEHCDHCGGRGMIKTVETVTHEIFREIVRQNRQFEAQKLLVIGAPKVMHHITEDESVAVAELEEFIGKSVRFQADDQYSQEQYDVVLL